MCMEQQTLLGWCAQGMSSSKLEGGEVTGIKVGAGPIGF